MTTIVKLEAENVKRIRAVSIEPPATGSVVIAGRNAQGKTSVLDAIWLALAGGDAAKAVVNPIRAGENTATAKVELSNGLTVVRKWRRKDDGTVTSTIEVETAEGASYKKPQGVLDAMIGDLSFDPLKFMVMKPNDQATELMRVAGDLETLLDLDRRRAAEYERRTELNREVKSLQAQAEAIPPLADGEPTETVDVGVAVAELGAANKALAWIASAERERRDAAAAVQDAKLALERAEAMMRLACEEEHSALAAKPVRGPNEIEAVIASASGVNQRVIAVKRRTDLLATANDKALVALACTDSIAKLDNERAAAASAVKMPVPGLAVIGDYVTFNGIPLTDCSASERIRVSLAFAMSANPDLKVVRIKDASLLDDEAMAIVAGMATDKGYQVWIERVGNEAGAVVIEDGEVLP